MTARHILDENKRLVTEFDELAINRRDQWDATEASTPKSSDFKSAGR
jgi:hypothetical protein